MSGLFEVCAPAAPLFRKAWRASALETQLVFGETFLAENVKRGWAKGQAQSPISGSPYPGYAGYVPVKYLRPCGKPPNIIVRALTAPLFRRPNIKSPVRGLWPMNARCRGVSSGDFYETAEGFIHYRHVQKISEGPDIKDFVTIAERHIGRPYIWAGVVSDGLDCSGLVQASLRAVGKDLPRDACDQQYVGETIPEGATLQRGDLIFWKGHVGVMQDAERMLHANAYHMVVTSEPLTSATARIETPITRRQRLNNVF